MGLNRANLNQIRLTQAASTGSIDNKHFQRTSDVKPQHLKRAIPTKKRLPAKKADKGATAEKSSDTVALRSKLIKEMKVKEREARYQKPAVQSFQARELKTIKGVLRLWLSSVLSPNERFHFLGSQQIQGNQLQQMLENWLMLNRSSIEAVEKFLEVQFAHLPDNYQIFVKLQLVKLIKDAKKILEDFENNLQLSGDPDEGTIMQHAATVGSAFGLALVKRRKKKSSYLDIREEVKGKELKQAQELQAQEKSFYQNIKNAKEMLEKAEQELKEAIKKGADKDKIDAIIEKLAEAYSIMMQLYMPKKRAYSEYAY